MLPGILLLIALAVFPLVINLFVRFIDRHETKEIKRNTRS